MIIPLRLAFALLLICLAPAGSADIVKPALIEISVFAEGRFRVELRASIEALLTGINGQYQNTTQAPTSDEYDRLRELEAAQLHEEFVPFQQRLLDAIELRFDGARAHAEIAKVEIPVPGYTKVPRISLIVLEGDIPVETRELTWYYPTAFGDNAVRVRQVDRDNDRWHWSAWQWIREDKTSEPFSLSEVFRSPGFFEVVREYAAAGFDHIIPNGLDHILFVLGLFLFSARLRPLLFDMASVKYWRLGPAVGNCWSAGKALKR